jgi:2-polyprenyl-3-methyl-5-hydroxy-6-metoxy-1,4-benzoquinol methylase
MAGISGKAAIRELLAAGADLHARGDLAEAERCFQRIVLLDPRHAPGLHQLGRMAHLRGDPGKAADLVGRSLALDSRNADAHHDLGLALSALGRMHDALTHFRQAAALQPSHAQACLRIAHILAARGEAGEAEEWNERFAELTLDHASALMRRGETHEALALLCRALQAKATERGKSLFVAWLRGLQEFPDTVPLANFLPGAISEPWCRPQDLAPLAVSLLKWRGPIAELLARPDAAVGESACAAIAQSSLLRAVLENVPLCDLDLEALLRALRRDILARAARGDTSPLLLEAACTLARQCFINEYVWDVAPEEVLQATALCEELQSAVKNEADVPALLIAVAAAYGPLHALALPPALLQKGRPAMVAAVLKQQMAEPALERQRRASIPHLTPIEDAVSRRVREQYEENPYPRWTGASPQSAQVAIDDALKTEFPRAPFRPLGKTGELDILVAGCGTGQQSIETARSYSGAHVLAVDLSLSSLAYAKRKTDEIGLANIDYAQADILALPALGRSFDMVDSIGVLHHMADPLAGWRALLSVLRPGGVMRVGLYSETARADIVAAQAFALGRTGSLHDVRVCRRAIAALPAEAPARSVTRLNDFFSASECRDLLFHVQEHRMTLPQIAAFIAQDGLVFLGFLLPPKIRDGYAARFPKDRAMTDLGNWHAFETERPQTFIGMYQFWIQKPVN